MSKEFNQKLMKIVDAALDLDEAERQAFLADACKNDPTLFKEAESFLRDCDGDLETLEQPAITLISHLAKQLKDDTPKVIGPYQILGFLGEGGMGGVYLAYQEKPVRRKVALKVLKARDANQRQRFQVEYHALGHLNHPNVTHIYDVGLTNDGAPYFAMEYTPGQTIAAYAREKGLILEDRIRLVIQLCEGMRHAHRRGIIHRDLKPSNVLVVIQGGVPTVKIIDFGIAKGMSSEAFEAEQPHMGAVLGSLGYLSPEQTRGPYQEVDTRTDVYGAGGVLYELLTGYAPHAELGLEELPIPAALERIRKKTPTPPSQRKKDFKTLGLEAERVAATWNKRLKDEIDWVLAKAMAQDPEKRYDDMAALKSDLTAFLACKPLAAATAVWHYRPRKWLQRNRKTVFSGAALLVLLGLAGLTVNDAKSKSRQARETAMQAEQKKVEATRNYEDLFDLIIEIVSAANPYNQNRDVRIVEVLDTFAHRIELEFPDHPESRSKLYATLGLAYDELGWAEKAEHIYSIRLKMNETQLNKTHIETLHSLYMLAEFYCRQEKFERGAQFLKKLDNRFENVEVESNKSLRILQLKIERVKAHYIRETGDPQNAIKLLINLREQHGDLFENNPKESLLATRELAEAYRDAKRFSEAIPLYRLVLEKYSQIRVSPHPDLFSAKSNLAFTLTLAGRYKEADQYHQSILKEIRDTLGEKHNITAHVILKQGLNARDQGNYKDANTYIKEAINLFTTLYGEHDNRVLGAQNSLGVAHLMQKDYETALSIFKQVRGKCVETGNPKNTLSLMTSLNIGITLTNLESYDQALTVLETNLQHRIERYGKQSSQAYNAEFEIGRNFLMQKKYQESVEIIERVYSNSQLLEHPEAQDIAYYGAYLGAAMIKAGDDLRGRQMLEEHFAFLRKSGHKDIREVDEFLKDLDLIIPNW